MTSPVTCVWGRGLCLALVLTVAGCSVQMAYNNLDRLVRWSLSDYVDMNPDQRAYFDANFESLWGWHRRSHLPQYAEFLDGVSSRLLDEATEQEMQALVDQVVAWAAEIEQRALPVAAELLASLTDDQVERLAAAMEESNREIAEPEQKATLEEAQALWRDDFADRFRQFSGRLTPVQRAYLEQQSQRYRPELVLWAEYRRRWQRDFLALLDRRKDGDAVERGLRALAASRNRYFGTELTEIYEDNNALLRQISVWLINSLSDRQRDRFRGRLGDLADDFRALAARETRKSRDRDRPPCLVRC